MYFWCHSIVTHIAVPFFFCYRSIYIFTRRGKININKSKAEQPPLLTQYQCGEHTTKSKCIVNWVMYLGIG